MDLNNPLEEKRVLILRNKEQSEDLYDILLENKAKPVIFPVLKIEPIKISDDLKIALKKEYDWIIFTSSNGVKYFFHNLIDDGINPSAFIKNAKIASVGKATSKKLEEYGFQSDFSPSKANASSLVKELNQIEDLKGSKILRLKGSFEDDPLVIELVDIGAEVESLDVYDLGLNQPPKNEIQELMEFGVDAILFTSVSTFDNFYKILGKEQALKIIENAKIITIGPVTSNGLSERGVTKVNESKSATAVAMVEALKKSFTT